MAENDAFLDRLHEAFQTDVNRQIQLPSTGITNRDYVRGIHDDHIPILDIEALLADPSLSVDKIFD